MVILDRKVKILLFLTHKNRIFLYLKQDENIQMKSVKYPVVLMLLGFMLACGPASDVTEAKNADSVAQMVYHKSFDAEFIYAEPMVTTALASVLNSGLLPPWNTANRIDLIGSANYLKMQGDTVSAYLPYFGERQMGGAYGNTGAAIEFDGIAKDLQISKAKKGKGYFLKFTINDKNNRTENYTVTLNLYNNLNTYAMINSSQRFRIAYQGSVKEGKKEH